MDRFSDTRNPNPMTQGPSNQFDAYYNDLRNTFPLNLINANKINIRYDYTNNVKSHANNLNEDKKISRAEESDEEESDEEESDEEELDEEESDEDESDEEESDEEESEDELDEKKSDEELLDKKYTQDKKQADATNLATHNEQTKQGLTNEGLFWYNAINPNPPSLSCHSTYCSNPTPIQEESDEDELTETGDEDELGEVELELKLADKTAEYNKVAQPKNESGCSCSFTMQDAKANANPFIKYTLNDTIGESTPEDEIYIENYKKTHGMDIINHALKNCSDNYNNKQSCINNISENSVSRTNAGEVVTDISISGKKFNEIYDDVPLVKLTNETCTHNKMNFVLGMNIDENKFDPSKACGPDGIYFCKLNDIHLWLDYSTSPMVYMWDAKIPDNARTVIYSNKLKTSAIILSNQRLIVDYLAEKILNMIETEPTIETVFRYIDEIPASSLPKNMEQIYLAILKRDPSLIQKVPETNRTYEICKYAAQHYDNAFQHIREHSMSYEILLECVKRDSNIYRTISPSLRSHEMSDIVFNHDMRFYEIMPYDHKSIDQTIKYLVCFPKCDEHVPKEHLNNPDVRTRIIGAHGAYLEHVEFRFKDKTLCNLAVNNCGMALEHVPLSLVDNTMCSDAVSHTTNAYQFVPDKFRTPELKDMLIAKAPRMIKEIPNDLITNSMIMSILNSTAYVLISALDFDNKNIRNLFSQNIKQYIDACDSLYRMIPGEFFDYETALRMVAKNPHAFNNFAALGDKFVIDCVKQGSVNFAVIDKKSVTLELLDELVTVRQSIIDEIPERFRHDGLYCICMKVHGMKLQDVPEQYRTSRFSQVALELYPEEGTFNKLLEELNTNQSRDPDQDHPINTTCPDLLNGVKKIDLSHDINFEDLVMTDDILRHFV
jgi:hypothetical protein